MEKEELEAKTIEVEKLQTRLKGYETLVRLAKNQQDELKEFRSENLDLKKRIAELEGTRDVSVKSGNLKDQGSGQSMMIHEAGTTMCENNDAILIQGLTDQQGSRSPANSHQGPSTSFTILSRSSREGDVDYNSTPKLLSLESCSTGKSHQEESDKLSCTKEHIVSIGNPEFEKTQNNNASTVSSNSGSLPKEGHTQSTLDGYVQVFPENSQSGGSNFYVPSMDSEIVGGQSCMNSSRRGPMSMLGVANGSLQSYQYVYTKGEEDEKKDLAQNEGSKSDARDAMPLISQPGLYDGTGARPKGGVLTQPRKSVMEGEYGHASKSEETMGNGLMVKIPCEDSQSYKINNAPMLSYGKQDSLTEISALTSFGSTLPSYSPDRDIEETGRLNNLSTGGHNLLSNLQAPTAVVTSMSAPRVATQEEFVIVEEVPPIIPSTNPIIPLVKPVADPNNVTDSYALLIKENEDLRKKTSQLHMANKEWKNRWDILKKQKEEENVNQNVHLQAQVRQLTLEKDRAKREMEHRIASQKEELKTMIQVKRDTDNAYTVLLTARSQEKQLLEKLKQDHGTLHQEKRSLEIQLEHLEANRPVEAHLPVVTTNSELETELAVVKRQVTLFMDDFNREHTERLNLETKLQKEKDTNQSLETKLRNTHALLKSRDEDFRQKSKKVTDLQYQVDDLKLKLEVEQRRSSIYPSMDLSREQGANVNVSRAPEAMVGPGRSTHASLNVNVPTPKPKRWSCIACTFENKMSHKNCDICGTPFTISDPEGRHVELD